MDPLLAGVATVALTEGVKFLYQQAGEILTAWRSRRRDSAAPPPRVLEPPSAVSVGNAQPVSDPPDAEAVDALQELKDLVEPIKDGVVPVDDAAARQAIAELRALVEAALRAPVTFEGEAPRPARVSDVTVVTRDVAGRVTGVRARLADVKRVRVEGGDVKPGGEVTGVDLG